MIDPLDAQVIEPLHEARIETRAAYPLARHRISRKACLMSQYRECGHLGLDGPNRRRHGFVPGTVQTGREVLRSRPDPTGPGAELQV